MLTPENAMLCQIWEVGDPGLVAMVMAAMLADLLQESDNCLLAFSKAVLLIYFFVLYYCRAPVCQRKTGINSPILHVFNSMHTNNNMQTKQAPIKIYTDWVGSQNSGHTKC